MTHRILLVWLVFALHAAAVSPRPAATEAFDKYLKLTQAATDEGFRKSGRLMRFDRMPDNVKASAFALLRKGEVLIEPLRTPGENGREIKAPDALIHHWLAAVFAPGATLQQAIALVQDYDNHQNIYRQEVVRSKLLKREGNEFEVFLRISKKKVITVTLNTVHSAHYYPVDATREYARSYMTRVAEVEDAENPDGPEKATGKDHGFLWKLASEWRFEQRDGGVYVECESVTLTRDIPIGVGWLIGSYVKSVPRETLLNMLTATRKGLSRS
jgi:hypothetical protein